MPSLKKFSWLSKEGKKRLNYEIFEVRKLALKSLLSSQHFNFDQKSYFAYKFNDIPKRSSVSFYKNVCFATALSRASFSLFKYSRHFAKYSASCGLLCGMRKSSF